MKIIDVEQNSIDWLRARIGIPTASNFHRILTKAKLEVSAASATYRHELLAEWALDSPTHTPSSAFMERGSEMEAKARHWYAFTRNVVPERVGFITDDEGTHGCSPDSLIGDDGLLEIKVPAAHTHVGYLLAGDKAADAYRLQIQGQLMITGRAWCDWMSFNPDPRLGKIVVRVARDEEVIGKLRSALSEFCLRLKMEREYLAALGVGPVDPPDSTSGGPCDDPERSQVA